MNQDMAARLIKSLPLIGWLILFACLLLTSLGIFGVWVGRSAGDDIPNQVMRQLSHLGVGLIGFALIQIIGYRQVGRYAYVIFGVILALLILLVVARKIPMAQFIPNRRNTYRWIVLGPLNFQVSEYAKVAFILALAAYLRFRTNYRTLTGLLGPFILTLIPLGLILKEPDLGTSLLLLPTLFVMLFAAGAKIRHLLLIIALGLAAMPAFYFSPLMSPYQRDRIKSLLAQGEDDPRWRLSSGYQLNQSKIALGSGQTFGRPLSEGAFFQHNLLPEDHNDFIFAVLGHQWGFLGCTAVLLCYFIIVASGLHAASTTTDPLGRLLAVGVSALILAQAVINVGMTIGLMPITGMTLPFVSMGGSALIANYLAIGLLVSVSRRRPLDIAPRPFEFGGDD
jgi:cell division protein FtsW (lipid II flippase)